MNLVVGRKPVLEALNSNESIEQVFILFGQKGGIIDAIMVAAKKRGIKCNIVKQDKFLSITNHPNAQGVAAKIESFKYYGLIDLINNSKEKKYPLLLLLDSIQDPHNLGAILRTAECSGVDGVIITKHNSASINETVRKVSAGATEHLKVSVVNNLANVIDLLKENSFWIVGSYLVGAKEFTQVDYKMPTALIMGNEEKGIRHLIADKCDFLVKIPMIGKIQSLNVSVATGVLLFEILKQRNISN
ncbi:MAG TPA: 23S rRNA (guanosine(2251)-2'-O)-methyltransferase RlmB [Ignavibacteriaceae bacterium]|nr:23S rRNA (guanosine(2251)-2'-O)-methyltransferase RlmB [Ignavibacteriaceae bacterium]